MAAGKGTSAKKLVKAEDIMEKEVGTDLLEDTGKID
jgi:hypothetical protein